eukprot:SAG31_NODE_34716_length_330_cov_0.675325_1_plen_54_part_10
MMPVDTQMDTHENPISTSLDGEEEEEDGTVLSEHLLARLDRQLSGGVNRPTPLF